MNSKAACSDIIGVLLLLVCLQQTGPAQERSPVLEMPQVGLDDTVAYRGYLTRFFRDIDGNTVQIVINQLTGRVMNVWADAVNESVSFTARDLEGRPVALKWHSAGVVPSSAEHWRYLQYTLTSESPAVAVGLVLLSSMRKERDYQYQQRHLLPFDSKPYIEEELEELLANLERLPAAERSYQLSLLHARNIDELQSRLQPAIAALNDRQRWLISVTQASFDGGTHLSLELTGDTADSRVGLVGNVITVRSDNGEPVTLTVRIGTDSPSLTPLRREQIFNDQFFRYYRRIKAEHDSLANHSASSGGSFAGEGSLLRFERFERDMKSVELLSFKEKLMAGLPNFATYFGRDMMVSAMMMETIWRSTMLEDVIAGVLRKLSPEGRVSHEEALGGQAIRENAGKYNRLLAEYFQRVSEKATVSADSALVRAREILTHLSAVREDYRMVDESFQLPVLVTRYLQRDDVPPDQKKAFLLDTLNGTNRLGLILRNLHYVYRSTAPFSARQDATNLVGFPKIDAHHWFSGSWRDSGAGYANGRFAMDVNVIWVPKALDAIRTILSALPTLGFTVEEIDSLVPQSGATQLRQLVRNPSALDESIRRWGRAREFFTVRLSAEVSKQRVHSRLSQLPKPERDYWDRILGATKAADRGITFLALSLDSLGKPIPVVNTDPGTLLFLEGSGGGIGHGGAPGTQVRMLIDAFVLPHPVGLFVSGLGPLAANDAYSSPQVWEAFERDQYHSPRVVWGREVNLFLLGISRQIRALQLQPNAGKNSLVVAYYRFLVTALEKIRNAVESSGMTHCELWSYKIIDGKLIPARYPTSSDIQLWNLTDLAVQYELDDLSR